MDPEKYALLDNIIQSDLVPALFDTNEIPAEFDRLFALPLKDAGLGILSLISECNMNHATSLASTKHLVGAILQEHELNLREHDWELNKGQWEEKNYKSEKCDHIFNKVCTSLSPDL
eukprot:3343360-Ditylum_brightwellii.AAC.1